MCSCNVSVALSVNIAFTFGLIWLFLCVHAEGFHKHFLPALACICVFNQYRIWLTNANAAVLKEVAKAGAPFMRLR